MIIGGFDVALAAWALGHWPDVINGVFTAAVARVQVKTALEAIKQEEIVGPAGRIVRLYFAWSVFTAWLFWHLGQPISAAMYGALAASQLFFLLACWLYSGTFNFDRRSDRTRWHLIRTVRRLQAPLPPDLFPAHASRADLPRSFCNVCGDETRHDLDGHCIICDTQNGSSMGVMNN